MNNLSSAELKVFNNLSAAHDPDVLLGSKLQSLITALNAFPVSETGTPVNAVEAKMDLTLTGVVIDGETVTIGTDVYEFLADAAQSKSTPSNIGIDITTRTVKATGSLTMDTQPTSGDTVTIGTKVYTFVPVGTDTADGEVSIGVDLAEAQANLVAAINGTDDLSEPHPLVTAADFDTNNVCAITALIGGTAGNAITTTETFTAASNVFAAAKLATGANCSAANAVTDLVAAITEHDTQGVGAAPGIGTVVSLTADVAGAAGNEIVLAKTMANAAFTGGATHLAGGVDGTIGSVEKALVDDTYLYICVDTNTVSGKNWRRISLGQAY